VTTTASRDAALALIRSNIEKRGQHVYLVLGSSYPRFAYSIGLSQHTGFELIVAGTSYYSNDRIVGIIHEGATRLSEDAAADGCERMRLPEGEFAIRAVHESWGRELALGAFDYYRKKNIELRQLVPPAGAWTIDVPDMSQPWSAQREPVWRWMHEPWRFAIPESSTVVTNLRAMRGERVTEGLRRDDEAWEIFVDADPDVPQEDVFVVPLSTLLGFDASLEPFTQLEIGTGLRRERGGAWSPRTP